MTEERVHIYPVGFLRDLIHTWNAARRARSWSETRQRIRSFRRSFLRSWRRRSYWNGYLAEPTWDVDGPQWRRCGTGWTRNAALRSLHCHLRDLAERAYR